MAHDWSYGHGPHGPDNWAENYPMCGGTRQSPINIDITTTIFKPELASLDASSYNNAFSESDGSASLINNGHSVQVQFTYNDAPTYYLQDGELGDRYLLEQFHFHWGSENHKGGEHTINGNTYPMEIHFVHYRSGLENITNAKAQEGGLVVLGAVFEVSDHNEAYEDIIANLANVQYSGQSTSLSNFRLSNFLPSSLHRFYRYHGSLTTPTCDENVTWLLLNERISISDNQMDQFRRLFATSQEAEEHKPLVNNYRPTQPVNDREIYTSFSFD